MIGVTRNATDAVVAALAATGLPVGDGEAPAGDLPYLIVDVMSGGIKGPLSDDHRWTTHTFHVRCVGLDRAGAEWARDVARDRLLGGAPLTVAGATVTDLSLEVSSVVARDDDDYGQSRFWTADRYALELDTGGQ